MHFLLIFLTPFVIIPKISLSFFMPYNYKTRPHALYMHKDGIKSRVTTLNSQTAHTIRLTKYLTILLQYNGCSRRSLLITKIIILIHDLKYLRKSIFPSDSDNVQCAACECIRYQFSMRLSPPGNSLYVPLILTSFSHCCYCLQLSSHAHYYKSCIRKCQCKVCVSYRVKNFNISILYKAYVLLLYILFLPFFL